MKLSCTETGHQGIVIKLFIIIIIIIIIIINTPRLIFWVLVSQATFN